MKNKQGITLMYLVITIIVILILGGSITIGIGNAVSNSRVSAFAQDLKEVEDATKVYYMLNGKLPALDSTVYTQGEITSFVPYKYKSDFTHELELNNDKLASESEGEYYLIDLSKIDIEQSTRGNRQDEDGNFFASNVFAVAYPSMNVYFLDGMKANNEVYFSLSSKITKRTNIQKQETIQDGNTSLTTSSGIIVKKESNTWSNDVNVIIESNMAENEKLYLQMVTEKHLLSTVTGKNILQLNDKLTTVYSNTTNQEYSSGITEEELNTFSELSQDLKKIVITKEIDGVVIGKVEVNLENFENDLPSIATDINISFEPTYNYIYFSVNDKTSGIEQVRYEYVTKIDKSGNSVYYFENIDSYDDNYMKSRAKKATVASNGLVEIKIPKDIESIQINIFDKAGNSSAKLTEQVITNEYIGINETEVTTTSLKIDTVFKIPTGNNVNSCKVQISTDGINYANEKSISLGSASNGVYSSNVNYDNLSNITDKIYVKVTLNYGNNVEVIRIKEIDVNTIKV